MVRHVVIAEALASWRQAERLLALLPDQSADYTAVSEALSRCRATYQCLSSERTATEGALMAAHGTVLEAREVLRVVRGRRVKEVSA